MPYSVENFFDIHMLPEVTVLCCKDYREYHKTLHQEFDDYEDVLADLKDMVTIHEHDLPWNGCDFTKLVKNKSYLTDFLKETIRSFKDDMKEFFLLHVSKHPLFSFYQKKWLSIVMKKNLLTKLALIQLIKGLLQTYQKEKQPITEIWQTDGSS